MKINLQFWQSGPFAAALAAVLEAAYDRIVSSLANVGLAADPERCSMELLELLAWQRGIDRFAGEDDALFRRRVKYAWLNSRDAGSASGFARIWERLCLGNVAQAERPDNAANRDVILIQVDYAVFSRYAGLWDELIRLYGRTCRRYVLQLPEEAAEMQMACGASGAEYSYLKAVY